jgi:rfaE bifunctional protein kinase chain/domain/rfaE bifunctional protein nucleotidyltransferase chain/domain
LACTYREEGKTVVLCHGTFDLVHLGHIRHFEAARRHGDVLMVTATADVFCKKGPGRPIITEDLRAENLSAFECVDHVAVIHAPTAVEAVREIRPDIYAKGSDYRDPEADLTGKIIDERKAVEEVGGRLVFTDELTLSSSSLINRHFEGLAPDVRSFIDVFRTKFQIDHILEAIKKLETLRVMVIGEAIIDRYTFTSPLGQTGKGPFLAVRYDYSEDYAGGALAVANHIASVAGNVTLVSGIGNPTSEESDYEAFMRSQLRDNVEARFFRFDEARTVVKERFVDTELSKLFEVYYFNEEPRANVEEEKKICGFLEKCLPDYDVVVVPDYGNGLISNPIIETVCRGARFLAVNTQINSGNRGYHVVTRYPRADFIALNEPELRLASHNRHDPIEQLARETGTKLKARYISVTRGSKGLLTLDRETDAFHSVPGLATRVVDRVGAGDAYLAFAATCLGNGVEGEVATFVGAAAAALDLQIVGNRENVEAASLLKFIATLLK